MGRLYFERADLLLRQAALAEAQGQPPLSYLQQALDTVEQFKTAELRDYFRDECVDAAQATPVPLERLSAEAVIVYPIALPDRLELLVMLPEGRLKQYQVPVRAPVLADTVTQFRLALEAQAQFQQSAFEAFQYAQGQRLYTWLVRPFESDLQAARVQTIVFVPDGALRTIPFAALHDGQNFLIQKYAVAVTPSLTLTHLRPLPREQLRVLAAGLSTAGPEREALPRVEGELAALQRLYGGTVLLNQRFTLSDMAAALQKEQFDIIHIASHATFARDARQSFLDTATGKLTLEELRQLVGRLRFRTKPLELLTLSACDTARGDDLAALGLAGVAIQAGARSALATLWVVRDEAASLLVTAFYWHLQQDPTVSRAGALQRAQQEMLRHPKYQQAFFWAPFLLINNWL